ncbi:TetR/AcrR family transcriptional regulator [Thermoflexus sp.]|uniref:TetR/AcrR family transcriptional regulator n=1 Tax=Thermoflexus sp. TaxID=1969742 RepID=UPI0035E442BA
MARAPVTVRGEQTRRRLLEAAEEVFGELGFHRASIAEIVRRAGVAQGTFYLYFDSKEEIFRALVRYMSHELRKFIARAVAGLQDRLEIEREGYRAFFRFVLQHRFLYRIVLESQFVDEEVYREYYRRLAEGYARGLAQAMEAGQIRRMDPETLAYCLMGIAHLLGMRWVLWENREPPEEVLETAMAFIRHGMALPPEGKGAADAPRTGE